MPGTPGNPDPSPATRFGGPQANPAGNGRGLPKGHVLAGRPPKLVREASRMGYYHRIPFLRNVADGLISQTQTVVVQNGEDAGKKVKIEVYPSFAERIRAVEVLAKFGGLASMSIDAELPSPADAAPLYNLRALSHDQLLQLEALLAQAAPTSLVATTDTGVEVHEHEDPCT